MIKKKNPYKKVTPAKKTVAKKVVSGKKLKIMVSSTVYGSESDLEQIYGLLKDFGYEVIMSKEGTVYVPIGSSTTQACLKAVEECDLFLGIIFPRYGSGITHKEFQKALELDKPRWFITHHFVPFSREILKQFMYTSTNKRIKTFKLNRNGVMDSEKVIDMYNDAIQNDLDPKKRKSNWAQPFFRTSEIMPFINTQFYDLEKRREELSEYNKTKKK